MENKLNTMDFWMFPTSNLLINTFLRGFLALFIAVYAFKTSWYSGYWVAIIHDIVSLTVLYPRF